MALLTGHSGTVMVVDDADDIRELICMQLRRRDTRWLKRQTASGRWNSLR